MTMFSIGIRDAAASTHLDEVPVLPGVILAVAFVVSFGNPLINVALMVMLSKKGCWLSFLSLKKQLSWSMMLG